MTALTSLAATSYTSTEVALTLRRLLREVVALHRVTTRQLPRPGHLEALLRSRRRLHLRHLVFTPAFFVGPSTMTMFRPSRVGCCSICPISLTSSARRSRSSLPRSGWRFSRPAEHDRHLHLGPLVEEPDDVPLLRLVVVIADLRPELDLLDVDRRLVLARLLRPLLLLVAVLPVVHHPGHGRVGVRGHLDEVEVLRVRVLERLLRLLDPDLCAVLGHEPHPRNADLLVDPVVLDDGTRSVLGAPPRSQRPITKSSRSSLFVERASCTQQRLSLVGSDSVEPRATRGRRGEGRCRSCLQGAKPSRASGRCVGTSGCAGTWQGGGSSATVSRRSRRGRGVDLRHQVGDAQRLLPAATRRTAIASTDSRSPQTTTSGTFSSSASRIRLPSVSSRASTSTRTPSSRSATASASTAP